MCDIIRASLGVNILILLWGLHLTTNFLLRFVLVVIKITITSHDTRNWHEHNGIQIINGIMLFRLLQTIRHDAHYNTEKTELSK
jgi:hypothetical protein